MNKANCKVGSGASKSRGQRQREPEKGKGQSEPEKGQRRKDKRVLIWRDKGLEILLVEASRLLEEL